MKEEYLKKEFWDRFPDATHFSPEDEGHYPAFWKVDESGKPADVWVIILEGGEIEHITQNIRLGSSDDIDSFIKRPESFPEESIGQENYIPKVGEECLALYNSIRDEYRKVRLIAVDDGEYLYRWLQLPGEIGINEGLNDYQSGKPFFKPLAKELTMEEKMLEAWKRQSLDYCIDNWKTVTTLEEVFGFFTKHFNIEEK